MFSVIQKEDYREQQVINTHFQRRTIILKFSSHSVVSFISFILVSNKENK